MNIRYSTEEGDPVRSLAKCCEENEQLRVRVAEAIGDEKRDAETRVRLEERIVELEKQYEQGEET